MQGEILVAVSATGLAMVWPHPTGEGTSPSGEWVKYGLVGSADIIGVALGGYFIAIEVKTGSGVQMDQQIRFEVAVKSKGGHYYVARDVEGAVSFVQMVAAGHREALVTSQPPSLL